jgi:fatty-acyl-CoA synthase
MLTTVQAPVARCPELREIICFDQWDSFLASGDDARIEPAIVRSTEDALAASC